MSIELVPGRYYAAMWNLELPLKPGYLRLPVDRDADPTEPDLQTMPIWVTGGDFLACLWRDDEVTPPVWNLTTRFRYYLAPGVFSDADRKHWHAYTLLPDVDATALLERTRTAMREYAARCGTESTLVETLIEGDCERAMSVMMDAAQSGANPFLHIGVQTEEDGPIEDITPRAV